MPSRPMPRRRSRPSTSRRTGRYENSGTWSPPQRPVCWRDADWPRTAHRNPGCSRHRHAGDLGPDGEGLVAGEMELRGGVLAWAAGENVGDLIVGGKKLLHLPRRLEALHDPLSSASWLVGILRPVIEAFVLAVLDARHDLSLGRGVAFQLVGDQHTRRSSLLLQQFAEQALGRLLVAPALDEDVENEALLVNCAPEPVLLASDGDDDLVQVPFVATTRGSPTDAVGKLPAEFQAPLADRLICHRDATRRQHLLDHAQAQRESKIQPDRVANELSGVAIAGIKRVSRRRHWARIPDLATSAKPDAAQLDGAVMTLAGQNTSASLARVATFAHNGHLRRDHLGLKRRCELLRLREPEPEVGQAGLLIALEAGDLHLRRQARLQFRNQLHSPNQLRHQLTLVP